MTKKRRKSLKRKESNFFVLLFKYLMMGIWFLFKYLGIAVYSIFKGIYLGISEVFKRIGKKGDIDITKDKESSANFPKGHVPKISVVETIKGDYNGFWNKLKKSDSLIGLVIGARGSGKSAIALSMAENFKNSNKRIFAMGFSDLPKWIKIVRNINEIKNDSLVVIDEGGILFSSRNSMSNSNKLLSELLFIARHKNLTILFVSQNSSNLEVNTLRQADFMVLKKSSLLQKNFERKIVAKVYGDHSDWFEKYKDVKGLALIYSDDFVGFVENDLPSFWSSKVSKSFR